MGLVQSNAIGEWSGSDFGYSDDSDGEHDSISSIGVASTRAGNDDCNDDFDWGVPLDPRSSSEIRILFLSLRKSKFVRAFMLIESAMRRKSWDVSPTLYANARDRHGRNLLHAAIRNYRTDPPLRLVQILLQLNSDQAVSKDGEGNTPLHYACDACSNHHVFQTLLHARPEAALISNRRGQLPIHMADSMFSATELARRYPETVSVMDDEGRTPLYLFTEILVRKFTRNSGYSVIKYCVGPDSLDHNVIYQLQSPPFSCISLPEVWETASAMVRATSHDTSPLLHAALRCTACPTVFIGMVCRIDPEQARTRDVWGDLPLHVAARELMSIKKGSGKCKGRGVDGARGTEWGLPMDDRLPLIRTSAGVLDSDDNGKNEDRLMRTIPQADVRGWDMRLQTDNIHRLHRIYHRGKKLGTEFAEDAVRNMLIANPDAVRERDAAGRLPLQCASAGGGMTWGGGARLILLSYPGALHAGGWGDDRLSQRAFDAIGAGGGPTTPVVGTKGDQEGATKSGLKRKRFSALARDPSRRIGTTPNVTIDGDGSCLNDCLLPRVLTKVGRDCVLSVMFEILRGRPDLVQGGVALRRSRRKRRKMFQSLRDFI